MDTKKRFFTSHAKSSAALVSIGIHAVLVIVALSFVAVTVITKEENAFEAKPVSRPKMKLKKLQVPVNIKKKKTQKPKLRKRIVVQPKMNQTMPDIKMPEITGVKGGLGNAGGDGLGGAGGVGFSMPEIEIFGIKGKGEKIVLILGAGADMMADEKGGIAAYKIIKEELVRIVEELPPTALFNVLIYDWKQVAMAFPSLVPANNANTKQMEQWLMPLNAVKKGMGANEYGINTLGQGGTISSEFLVAGKMEDTQKVRAQGEPDLRDWYRASALAQKMAADTVFVLTDQWGIQRIAISERGDREAWNKTSAGKKWAESYKEGLRMLDEENKKRAAAGEPPKILSRNEWEVCREYFPDIQRPPSPEWYHYTPRDIAEGYVMLRDRFKESSGIPAKSGLKKKRSKKVDFSLNVVQFVPQGEGASEQSSGNFKSLTGLCNGQYKTVAGLAAIQSYVTSSGSE